MGRAAVVADDAQHRLAVGRKPRERAELARHFGRGGIADAREDRGQRAAQRAPGVAVIGQPRRHQEPADIGVAQAQRAVLVAEPRDLARRELRHQHRDFERDGPQPDGVLVGGNVVGPVFAPERQQIERGEIARRVVQEHVFRARVRRVDAPARGAGVPLVDGGVELQAGIGRGPGGVADLVPQIARLQSLRDLAVGAPRQAPLAVLAHALQEVVRDAHGIVRVLARDGEIGLAVPIGVVGLELDRGAALLGELDDALDIALGDHGAPRRADLALQGGVLRRIAAARPQRFGGGAVARRHDEVQVLFRELRAGDERRHLLLLDHLPFDVGFDVGMIDIDRHHLGGAPGRAARLDGARRAVADPQEAHQARRAPAARKPLALAAHLREIRAAARAVLEDARLAHPQIHDPALVDEIVIDRLDEAGVRLRMLVGAFRRAHLAALVVDVIVALRRPVDAVGPVEAGIEPLRRVGHAHLLRQHEAGLVVIGPRIGLAVEIAALPAPVGPGAGEPVEHFLGARLRARARRGRQVLVRHAPPQPFRHVRLGNRRQLRRHARLAEIFLREDVARDLAPERGHLDVGLVEDARAVGVADLARRRAERDAVIGLLARNREATLDAHLLRSPETTRLIRCFPTTPGGSPGVRTQSLVPNASKRQDRILL